MKTTFITCASLLLAWTALSWPAAKPAAKFEFDKETPLWDVMSKLGKIKQNMLDTSRPQSAQKGLELVQESQTTDFNGRKIAKIASIPCLACHNAQPEYNRLDELDPQKRLIYADSAQMPFLPGAPFYGIVNRIYFFTEDYQTIYKNEPKDKLIKAAHVDLRKAIQACNQVYAKGRELENWEVESILAYFWSLEIKMGDLNVPEEDMQDVSYSLTTNLGNAKAVNVLRRHYPEVYPATLTAAQPVAKRKKTSPILNNFSNGRKIYELSCLYCHGGKKYADFKLDEEQSTFLFLKKNFDDTTSRFSIYDALRYSPTSKSNRSGTPHFTQQRLSDQQLQDLRFYIIQMAKFGDEAYEYFKHQKENSRQ